jgi:hypothetical protein
VSYDIDSTGRVYRVTSVNGHVIDHQFVKQAQPQYDAQGRPYYYLRANGHEKRVPATNVPERHPTVGSGSTQNQLPGNGNNPVGALVGSIIGAIESGNGPSGIPGYIPDNNSNNAPPSSNPGYVPDLPAGPQNGPQELFNARLGIWFTPIPYADGSSGVRLTRYPVPGSPMAQIELEPGDTIYALDGESLRGDDDLNAHYGATTVDFINVRNNRR